MMALLLAGSASLLSSCDTKPAATVYDYETLMTESSENRTITMMENGKRSYSFTSPLMEGYSMASNPYQEFRRGICMTTFTDSLSLVDATITANYAIYYERQRLWEAKGNVVIIKNNREEGDTAVKDLTEIYTQQLFWNATTKKIYSNVDTKVLQADGWHFGVGFDADDDLKNIHFRKYSSEMEFDMSQPDPAERAAREEAKEKEANDKETKDKKGENKPKSSAAESAQKSTSGANGGVKRPPMQQTGASRGALEHNMSPLPAGHTERAEVSVPPRGEQSVTTTVAPSMGNRQGGKVNHNQQEAMSAAKSGASLRPTSSDAKRAGAKRTERTESALNAGSVAGAVNAGSAER